MRGMPIERLYKPKNSFKVFRVIVISQRVIMPSLTLSVGISLSGTGAYLSELLS